MDALDNLWGIEVVAFVFLFTFLLFWLIFKGYRKIGTGRIFALLLTIPTWLFVEVALLGKMSNCWDSETLKNELHAKLSPKEFASVKPIDFMCPLSYSYIQNGKIKWAGFIGEKIDFGDGNSSP